MRTLTCATAAALAIALGAACSSGDDDAHGAASEPDGGGTARAGNGGSGNGGSGTGSGSGGDSGGSGSGSGNGGSSGSSGRDGGAGDAATEPDAATPTAVSYVRDVAPVLAAKCTYCHHPDSPTQVDLTHPFDPEHGVIGRPTTWSGAEGTPMIDPGHPENSFLITKITREDLDPHGVGGPMPALIERLGDADLAALRQWISDGANDDAAYQDTITLIFGDGETLGSRSGKCAICHYAGGTLRPDLTHPFDPVTGAVGVTGVYGRVLIAPGDPDASFLLDKVSGNVETNFGATMPLWLPRVTEAEADTISRWIAEGAQNN